MKETSVFMADVAPNWSNWQFVAIGRGFVPTANKLQVQTNSTTTLEAFTQFTNVSFR